MNDTSAVSSAKARASARQLLRRERPRVDPLEHDDARIAPHPPIELVVAHVERHDPRRAAPEQDVGEPAGRRPDVEREAAA